MGIIVNTVKDLRTITDIQRTNTNEYINKYMVQSNNNERIISNSNLG